MQKIFIISVILLYSLVAVSQNKKGEIDWITIEKAQKLFKKKQKPILIYFYDNDNDSCKIQDTTTFAKYEVTNYINVLFYPVKINVKSNDTIKFLDGKNYIKHKRSKVHAITKMLLGDSATFPALLIFNKKAQGRPFFGYKNRDDIFRILIYYAEDIYNWVDFESWKKYHTKGYPPGKSQIMTRLLVKWKKLSEALELSKSKPRKIILSLYNYNKISSTLMRTQTFNQRDVAKYVNEKFYPVNIDVFTQDTLEIFNKKYINENKPYKYHQLPIAALEGKMIFPVYIILNEDKKVLEKVVGYQTPEMMDATLHYYGENKYKTISFKKFKKTFKSIISESTGKNN